MLLAWTTVANRADAERIATDVVAQNFAICVQIDGPLTSHYPWQGRAERAEEFRLCFKCRPTQLAALEAHAIALEQRVLATHPYETPEWIVVRAERVGEKYLSWANANSTTAPLNNSQPRFSKPCPSTKASKAPPVSSSNAMF